MCNMCGHEMQSVGGKSFGVQIVGALNKGC